MLRRLRFGLLFALALPVAACQKGTQEDKTRTPAAGTGAQGGTAATTGTETPKPQPPKPPPKAKQVTPPLDVKAPPADATKTDSGLVFRSLAEGTGASPGRNDAVKIRYSAWRPDGTTFATTEGQADPTTMPLYSAAPGFAEALMKMKTGGKAMFWVPPEIGYPRRPPPNAEQLAYAVELVEIVPAPAAPADLGAPPADANKEASGVAWKKVKTAAGKADKPRAWDAVELAYTGWDASGKILDSTEVLGRPIKVEIGSLPPVFAEAVPALAVGERARVWFPADLLGMRGPDAPQGTLTFELELKGVQRLEQPPPAPPDVAAPPADAKKTPKGVSYKVLKQGNGPKPTAADTVTVHYTGWTTDGKRFDTSITGGQPRQFRVGGVIQGWTDALLLMSVGDKWRIWIPEELAYKGNPTGPQGMLVFDVELLGIQPAGAPPARP